MNELEKRIKKLETGFMVLSFGISIIGLVMIILSMLK